MTKSRSDVAWQQRSRGVSHRGWIGALGVLLSLAAFNALAWGREGHQLVAAAAMQRLTPAAKAQVEGLLSLEPGSSLESIATWADEFRSPSTAGWHYVNFRQGEPCAYQPSQCPDNQCVVAAIGRQAEVLASKGSDEQRLKALKYLVHFVADVHQPLHAGYLEDRGGNTYQVHAFGKGTNLHAVWDVALIEHWPGGSEALASEVNRTLSSRLEHDDRDPRQWAEASCRIVASSGFYPDGHRIDASYADRWRQTLIEQLVRAADRLAGMLSTLLDR